MAVARQALEPRYVNLLPCDLQEVAARPGQHTRAPRHRVERLAQPPDVDAHRMIGPCSAFTTINVPGAAGTFVDGINDAAQPTGNSLAKHGLTHGFLNHPSP